MFKKSDAGGGGSISWKIMAAAHFSHSKPKTYLTWDTAGRLLLRILGVKKYYILEVVKDMISKGRMVVTYI